MKKIDIDATMVEIRKALEYSASIPGQDAAELACNRDGIEAHLAFARWSYEARHVLEPNDYAEATGMLLGSMLIGSLGAIDEDDHPAAIGLMLDHIAAHINRKLDGEEVDGDASVKPVTLDVGDA